MRNNITSLYTASRVLRSTAKRRYRHVGTPPPVANVSYRVRRPVLVAICVAMAFMVALAGTLVALQWLNH